MGQPRRTRPTREDCTEPDDRQPGERARYCWQSGILFDIFDLDGAYLGALEPAPEFDFGWPFISEDRFIVSYEDESGAAKVRVYRILLPEGAS